MRSSALLLALLPSLAAAASPLTPKNKLFGHAIKGASLPAATEVTTFQYNCTVAPCVVTQLHVPSIYAPQGCVSDWEHGRLRLYIDGESTASIDVKLLELASVSFNADIGTNPAQDGSPWGHDLFGKTANNGGVYSTFRIPFQSSIRSTIEAAPGCADASVYWFIIRGVEGMPVQLGEDFILPANAKLNIQRNVNVTLQPLDYITIAAAPSGQGGALLNTYLDSVSSDYNFLEACVRFYADGAASPQYLSSGTEDYFLSSSYFDENKFTTSQSGLTYKQDPGSMSAYKTHTRDYIIWNQGMNLTWRNMENSCPSKFPWSEDMVPTSVTKGPKTLTIAPAVYNTIVWFYTWPSQNESVPAPGAPFEYALEAISQLQGASLLSAADVERVIDLVMDEDARLLALLKVFGKDDQSVLAKRIVRLLARL